MTQGWKIVHSRDIIERIEELRSQQECPNCGGDGDDPDDLSGIKQCSECGGTGIYPEGLDDDERELLAEMEELADSGITGLVLWRLPNSRGGRR